MKRLPSPIQVRRVAALAGAAALALLLNACGGGGSGGSALTDPSAAIAAQVDEIRPADESESVGVFVELNTNAPAAGAVVADGDARRTWLQQRFIADLEAAAATPLAGAATAACQSADLQQRLVQATRPAAGAAVRIELTACELDLLPRMPMVRGVHADRLLSTQAAGDATALHQAIVQSFDGQTAWPTLGGKPLAGASRVIAVLDTGVDARHPALGKIGRAHV